MASGSQTLQSSSALPNVVTVTQPFICSTKPAAASTAPDVQANHTALRLDDIDATLQMLKDTLASMTPRVVPVPDPVLSQTSTSAVAVGTGGLGLNVNAGHGAVFTNDGGFYNVFAAKSQAAVSSAPAVTVSNTPGGMGAVVAVSAPSGFIPTVVAKAAPRRVNVGSLPLGTNVPLKTKQAI